MSCWFYSDPHFWHANVIKYCNRPWATAEEMNEGLIERYNATVGETDRVFFLGDVAFCGFTKLKEIMPRLRGRRALILGNHDRRISPAKWYELGFDAVMPESALMLKSRKLMLSHFPFTGDHTAEDRYKDLRPKDDGHSWLAHGHVHTAWKVRGRQINVGVDVWDYRPVNLETITKIVESRGEYEHLNSGRPG